MESKHPALAKLAADLTALVDQLERDSASGLGIGEAVAEHVHELRERAEQLIEHAD